ncbi:unnamed protein product [Allacma fusca]|uniref:EamA domain-containing protein n=1 Tax=Allacma fusca TaxID=39272 RepID=A0A8J2LEW3_9HEXA|nr:unnamed protein product [Allacma fusca]
MTPNIDIKIVTPEIPPHQENRLNNNSCNCQRGKKEDVKVVVGVTIEKVLVIDERNKWLKYRGFLFTLLSSLCFSITALLVKLLKDYDPINVALWRFQGAFLPAIPLLLFWRYSESWDRRNEKVEKEEEDSKEVFCGWLKFKVAILLLTRSILTCNALLLHFYSLKYLELGDALVISSSTPVFTYFFAHYMLDEPCGIVPIVTSVTTLLGVVVIIRPPHLTGKEDFDFDTLVGAGLALGCTLLATISFVVLRYLRRVHYSVTTFAFGSWGTVENLVLAVAFGVFSLPRGTYDWLLASALASLTFFGQIAIIMALKCEQTGPVSLVRTCDVIFGFLWQIVFWQVVPDMYSLVGASIIVLGVVLTGIRKWLGSLPVNNTTRTKFWFVLK